MQHIINCLVENKAGVLANISGLFSARNFNIISLAVGETEDPKYSRMTITAKGDEAIVEQIEKHLNRLVNVIKVTDCATHGFVERDLMLLRINCPSKLRAEVGATVDMFEGKIVDIGVKDLTVEISGPEAKIDAFINVMRPYGIKELARTGRIAMMRTSADLPKKTGKRMPV